MKPGLVKADIPIRKRAKHYLTFRAKWKILVKANLVEKCQLIQYQVYCSSVCLGFYFLSHLKLAERDRLDSSASDFLERAAVRSTSIQVDSSIDPSRERCERSATLD